MASVNFDALSLGDISTSGKGARSVPFLYGKDQVIWQPEAPMTVAYEPGVFSGEDAARVNICFRPPSELQDVLVQLDEWVVEQGARHSERLFGRPLSEDQVRAKYQPALKVSDKGYPPILRCKMNVSGKGQVRIWQDKKPREAPETWAGCSVNARIWLKSLYLMGGNFGCTFEVSDLCVVEEPSSFCPF
jgi:hypothetical protein